MSQPHTILVVDDEHHILQVLTLKLRNAGYSVVTAVDGEEGLETASRIGPDLIISDYQMPYMSGLELSHALAQQQHTKCIPILLLTARGFAIDEKDVRIGNIKAVLSKPFSPRSIIAKVDEILGRTKATSSQEIEADRPARDGGDSQGQSPTQKEAA